MFVSRKRTHFLQTTALLLNGLCLQAVASYKYLGITISSDLTWHLHINKIYNKTRRQIELLYRKFYQNSSPTALMQFYESIVRPHIEYSSPVWSPFLKDDIACIEKVQKFALNCDGIRKNPTFCIFHQN